MPDSSKAFVTCSGGHQVMVIGLAHVTGSDPLNNDVLERETAIPRWRDLLGLLRRMEARGEVRGGRFISGFGGEQFALPEALESLREARRNQRRHEAVSVAGADPLNLMGILIPGERVAAVPGNRVVFDEAALTPLGMREAAASLPKNEVSLFADNLRTSASLPLPRLNYDDNPTA